MVLSSSDASHLAKGILPMAGSASGVGTGGAEGTLAPSRGSPEGARRSVGSRRELDTGSWGWLPACWSPASMGWKLSPADGRPAAGTGHLLGGGGTPRGGGRAEIGGRTQRLGPPQRPHTGKGMWGGGDGTLEAALDRAQGAR